MNKNKMGAPIKIPNGQRRHVILKPDDVALVTQWGHGKFSDGVRLAIQVTKDTIKEEKLK